MCEEHSIQCILRPLGGGVGVAVGGDERARGQSGPATSPWRRRRATLRRAMGKGVGGGSAWLTGFR